MGDHPSIPFNPLLANAFFRAGYIESWGRGFAKIQEECRAHGIAAPEVDASLSGLTLTFKASGAYRKALREDPGANGDLAPDTETREKTREKILGLLEVQPMLTGQEMAELLDLSSKGIDWQLRKLKEEGALRRIGSDKGGRWEVLP